jgi:hypothetical protein
LLTNTSLWSGKKGRSEPTRLNQTMLLIEAGLVLLLYPLALVGSRASFVFSAPERMLASLARRRGLSILCVGLLELILRVALLPILPIPYPGVHDEYSYLLMGDTFAHGRLTNPTHPLWIHFESVTVIHQPTYCSMYYPAQSLFLALGQLIAGHPFWGVCLSAALMCAAVTWMLQGWVAPFWALIGGLLAVIRLGTFSYWVNSYFGGAVAAIGGALVLGALPRIKKSPRVRDALLMGAGFALLANSRPYEGLFFSLPIVVALVIWLWKKRDFSRSFRSIILPLVSVLVFTACFMLYYFWRTTGNPFRPPYFVNLQTYFVDPGFPWLPLRAIPQYHHQIMRNHYLGWSLSQFQYAQAHPIFAGIIKLLMSWFFFLGPLLTVPFLMLGVVLPTGTSFQDVGRNARLLLIVCFMTLIAILLPAYANPHYAAAITAAIYGLIVMAMQRVRRWRVGGRRIGISFVRITLTAALLLFFLRIAIPVFHLPILNGALPETWCSPWNQNIPRKEVERTLAALPGKHLVLVRYGAQHDPGVGWVNNSAAIDSSRIVWAHDMGGSLNKELIDYFKDRKVWIVEPDENPIRLSPYLNGETASTPE